MYYIDTATNKVYGYKKEGTIELVSPIKADGTVYNGHQNIHLCEVDSEGNLYPFYQATMINGVYLKDDVNIAEQLAIKAEEDRKKLGEIYALNGEEYAVSFMKDDADGMLQVKTGFELGLTSTNIHFENGTVMPISATDFPAFASWFVEKRNSFFV